MPINLSAGIDEPQIDLSAGVSPATSPVDLSAGLGQAQSDRTTSPVVPGNIQLYGRPRVSDPNKAGYSGTVHSASREEDGYEVLFPTVYDGAWHTEDEGWQHYKQTGEHMGKWKLDSKNPDAAYKAADAYGQKYHEDAAAGKYDIDLSAGIGKPQPATRPAIQPPSVWDRIQRIFSDDYLGKGIGVASRAERAVDEPIEKATKVAHAAIDSASDWLLQPRRDMELKLADSGYPGPARVVAYGEAVDPINWTREGLKVAAGTVIDPKNWPLLLQGGGSVRPALKAVSSALFSAMQQTGAVEALRNHDWSSAALQEGFALIGLKDLPENVKATIANDAAVHAEGPASVIAEKAPDVQLTDTSTAKAHIESEDTIHPAPNTDASVRAPDDTAPLRQAKIVAGDSIPVVSRNEILASAVQKIVNDSGELAKLDIDPSSLTKPEDIQTVLDQAADHLSQNMDPRALATLSHDEIKQLAAEVNMSDAELLSRKSGTAFSGEHAVAARALLDANAKDVLRLAGQATDDPSTLPAMKESLAKYKAILGQVKGVAAEAGRALASFNIKDLPENRAAQAMLNLSDDAAAEAAKLLAKIDINNKSQLNNFIEKITPASTSDKIWEAYRNSLLSGPSTLIKKAASDAAMIGLETASKFVAGGIEKMKASPERFASEAWFYAKGAVQALGHAKEILSGQFNLEDAPGFEKTGMQAIKGPLGEIIRIPSLALSRITNVAYSMNYFGELQSLAVRQAIQEGLKGEALHARQEWLAHNPTSEMAKAADSLALKNTFQARLGATGQKVQSLIRDLPLGRYIVPFWRTPVNLLKATENFSPSGLLRGTLSGDVDLAARGVVGSAIAAGVAALALDGRITGGGPVDLKKRDTLESTGWQPYSVKIGNKYYSYRRLEPVGLTMALVSDAVHSLHIADPEVVSNSKADVAINHVVRSLREISFLPTLSSLFDALDNPGARAQSFIDREAGSLVPSLVAEVAKATDRTLRKPQGITQTIESRMPGLTQRLPAAVDISGQEIKRPASSFGGANPFPVTRETGDRTISELARLGISTPNAPSTIKLRGNPSPLTQNEKQQLAEEEGKLYYQQTSRVIASGSWSRKSDDQKRESLTEIRRDVDQGRAARLIRIRKAELARSSLQ